MTIASEITKLNTNLTNSYTACNNKGATMPTNQNFDNLATCISSIQTGGSPNLQTKSVSLTNKNGQTFSADNGYDGLSSITVTPSNKTLSITPSKTSQTKTVPTNYSGYGTVTCSAVTSSIDSNIQAGNIKSGVTILGVTGNYTGSGGGGGASYTGSLSLDNISNYILKASNGVLTIESWKDSSETLYSVNETILLEDNIFEESYADDTSIVYACLKNTSINPDATSYCFYDTFSDCTNLEKVDISLEYAGSSCFFCTFFACSKLKSVTFFGLQQVKNGYRTFLNAFSNSGIENIYFPSLVEDFLVGTGNRCFEAMLEDVDGCTVHFPSNLQTVLEDYPTVLDGFGGTNTTVLFDLPATT